MAISGSIRNVRISGIACAVPKKVVSNARFVESFGADQMAKFEKMVGIKERRFATDTSTADLSIAAAEVLRKELMWSAGDVDALIFVSQTPNHVIPATACDIQHILGIKRDCVAYDINLGCSGFV